MSVSKQSDLNIASVDGLVRLQATNPDIALTPMTPLGAGRFQSLVTIRPAPERVTVTSSLGGFASTVVP